MKGSLDTFNKFILINDVIDTVVQMWVFVFVWALETGGYEGNHLLPGKEEVAVMGL